MFRKGKTGLDALSIAGVGLAGALGAWARYGVGRVFHRWSKAFPWGTFTINVLGCLAISVAGALALRAVPVAPFLRLYAMTGFIGAFTTFSTFQLEAVTLARSAPLRAVVYLLGSTAAGLFAVWLGAVVMGSAH